MTRKLSQPIETAAAVLSTDFSLDANNPYLCKPKNELSFAIAKQPYLEADRPIGKSLSRGKGFRDWVAWIKIIT